MCVCVSSLLTVINGFLVVESFYSSLDPFFSGGFAFIAELSYYQVESAKDCDLTVVKERFYPTNYAWAMQKDSPLLKVFTDRCVKFSSQFAVVFIRSEFNTWSRKIYIIYYKLNMLLYASCGHI